MWLRGYDAWKTSEPDYNADNPVCEHCGDAKEMARGTPYVVWICERCDEPEPDEGDE